MSPTPAYNNATLGRTIVSTGNNVGIGTSTPSGQLHVIGTGLVSSTLGINTNAPSGAFDVAGNAYFRGATTGTVTTVYFKAPGYSDTSLKLRTDASANLYLDAGPQLKLGNQDGRAEVLGYSGPTIIGHTYNANGGLYGNQNIQFKPANTESMRLTPSGYLGIGTTNPSYQLHVNGSGFVASGLAVSGSLTLNSTGVSLSGHTHTSSNITDFNSAVSGLLPVKDIVAGTNITVSSTSGIYTINSTASGTGGGGGVVVENSGNDRILTSTGSSSGINAEANLTFNGSLFTVTGSGYFASGCSITGVLNVQVIKQPVASGTDGATVTFDMNKANVHTVTLGGNRTLAVSNVDIGQRFTIRLKQDASPPRTVTWFSGIYWPSAKPPILTRRANAVDVFSFICTASGKYDGYIVGYNFPNA